MKGNLSKCNPVSLHFLPSRPYKGEIHFIQARHGKSSELYKPGPREGGPCDATDG